MNVLCELISFLERVCFSVKWTTSPWWTILAFLAWLTPPCVTFAFWQINMIYDMMKFIVNCGV